MTIERLRLKKSNKIYTIGLLIGWGRFDQERRGRFDQ